VAVIYKDWREVNEEGVDGCFWSQYNRMTLEKSTLTCHGVKILSFLLYSLSIHKIYEINLLSRREKSINALIFNKLGLDWKSFQIIVF
jgi:hypothetical protein